MSHPLCARVSSPLASGAWFLPQVREPRAGLRAGGGPQVAFSLQLVAVSRCRRLCPRQGVSSGHRAGQETIQVLFLFLFPLFNQMLFQKYVYVLSLSLLKRIYLFI